MAIYSYIIGIYSYIVLFGIHFGGFWTLKSVKNTHPAHNQAGRHHHHHHEPREPAQPAHIQAGHTTITITKIKRSELLTPRVHENKILGPVGREQGGVHPHHTPCDPH